jgi:hypothetical protein
VVKSSNEGGKVLNQLIETLLKPIEDVQRYICVLQHLCWQSEQLNESEILCPIVDYATQLIPQLQQMWKASQALRDEHANDDDDSDVELRIGFNEAPARAQINGSVARLTRPSVSDDSSPEQVQSLLKSKPLNFSSIMKAIEFNVANDSKASQLRRSNTAADARVASANSRPDGAAEAAQLELHELNAAAPPAVDDAAGGGDSDLEVRCSRWCRACCACRRLAASRLPSNTVFSLKHC